MAVNDEHANARAAARGFGSRIGPDLGPRVTAALVLGLAAEVAASQAAEFGIDQGRELLDGGAVAFGPSAEQARDIVGGHGYSSPAKPARVTIGRPSIGPIITETQK